MALSPLINAVLANDPDTVRRLLDGGADVNLRENSETPLTWAAYNGFAPVVKLLLARGADTAVKDAYGRTPFDLAKLQRHTDVMNLLRDATPAAAVTQEGWVRMGTSSVAQIGTYPDAGRKLTHVFNFETRQHFLIAENTQTKAESTTPFASFDELPRQVVEKALAEFTNRGGQADQDFVFDGTNQLNKKRNLPKP